MADINFKTQELANLYLYGLNAANAGHLEYFRSTGTTQTASAQIKADILALDQRIANFQNVITDGAKVGNEDFPYDKEYLKREFMEEVFAILMKRENYRGSNVVASGNIFAGSPTQTVDGQTVLFNSGTILGTGQAWSGNFSDMTLDQMKSVIKTGPNEGGVAVFEAYSAWIDAVFAEGNKMKDNPAQSVTVVTSIPERTLPTANSPDVIYDRVATIKKLDANGNPTYQYFLVAKGATISDLTKISIPGTLNNQPADSLVVTTSSSTANSVYIEVDKDLQPLVNNAYGFEFATRNLSPTMYLYYFMEARIRILRGQLNMKEAVTTEIRDDLAKANSAYADLEAQAGKTRAQSADGKTVNPDLSVETTNMDFFEATNSKKGELMYDNTGNDDLHNYANWGASRSSLKAYIDRKSTQSQDAMLDYQSTLNRFNQAYEVMSKIQEKMDGLLKSQLRNVG